METTQAPTPCSQETFSFQALESRRVEVDFSGGYLSSDGGSLLLREVESKHRLIRAFADCFTDHRFRPLVEHPLEQLLAQRVHAIALGYEDINDHDHLRLDPVLALCCDKGDLLGEERSEEDRGKALAGKSTLNRLELGSNGLTKTKKIQPHPERIRDLLIDEGVKRIPRRSREVTLDFDATDDPLHGSQEGRIFHGYYGHYCYLPLYCFCGDIPLWAELRQADIDASKGTLEALQIIVAKIRRRLGKKVRIILRADSGFCRDEILTWIEKQRRVHYVIGLAKNNVLKKLLAPTYDSYLEEQLGGDAYRQLCSEAEESKQKQPRLPDELDYKAYTELEYRTQKSWSRERRVIGKAAITKGKINPRFLVTDLAHDEDWARSDARFETGQSIYEDYYCARGDMENRIKEQQMDMFADRTSTSQMASNQLRLWFSTFAYMTVRDLRADALVGTRLEKASVGQVRLKLFKIAAQLTVSVRRIYIRLCSACAAPVRWQTYSPERTRTSSPAPRRADRRVPVKRPARESGGTAMPGHSNEEGKTGNQSLKNGSDHRSKQNRTPSR